MFDRLKSLFIEDSGKSKPAVDAAPEANEAELVQDAPAADPAGSVEMTLPAEGKVSEKFVNILIEAMERNNIEGYDYFEFKQSLKSLAKVGSMDDQTRFVSAFAAAQPMGITKQKLVDTAAFYLDTLLKEEQKFETALKSQRTKQIGNREDHVRKLGNMIAQKEQQIEQLQKEIELNRQKMTKISDEISQSSIKVTNTKNNFIASYNFIVSQIKRDVESINKYLS